MRNIYSYFVFLILLSSCGGGGSSTPPVPTVSLSSSASEVEVGNTVTLTWSSTNATSCNASGSWTGSKGISGSEQITIGIAGPNNFSLSCSGESITSGSASTSIEGYRVFNGKVVDGYIRGAMVFIDTNNNFTEDSNEPSVVSDNSGGFELRYANGTLLSLGGFDLDSANLLDNLMLSHPLSGHTETKVITPVTSLLIGMEDSSQLKAALGIDNSIDISILDPVANKGDGGIYDYLYEKGNQLTVLALALQNITNDINASMDTTQDYFAAIAAEVEEAYTLTQARVDIESEAFISEVLENVMTAKTLSISNEIKTNISSALASVMPVIEVKSSDLLTQSTLNFATSTLQTDIVSIAKGEADEKLSQYQNTVLNLIASDQNIELGGLAPGISAIADSLSLDEDNSASINLLANDSYLGSASISITIGSASNGSISVSGGTATYTPNSNFNGTETISYTITQGSQTSTANLSITVNPVQDVPVISSAASVSLNEGDTVVISVNASDADSESLSYTISGTDASMMTISSSGQISLNSAADYEVKTGYSVTVSVSDGTDSVAQTITVTVIDRCEFDSGIFGTCTFN